MEFPKSYFEDEVRDGFYVPSMMKRAWAAQLEVLEDIEKICRKHNIDRSHTSRRLYTLGR